MSKSESAAICATEARSEILFRGARSEAKEGLTMTQPLRAILYDRVSTKNQARSGYSGGADGFQLDRCRAYAEGRGWSVVGTLTDVGSGANWFLPGLLEAVERAKRHEYDVLVVSDTSRFARDLGKKIMFERNLAECGVKVAYTTLPDMPVDNTPDTKLINDIMQSLYGSFDAHDRDKRTWATSQGRLKKAQTGSVVGNGPAPYGYVYDTEWNETRKKLVTIGLKPNPDTAPVVQRLYRSIVHASSMELAQQLNRDGVPAPRGGRWPRTAPRRILLNPAYKGAWHFGDVVVPVPALVDESTWNEAQRLLHKRHGVSRGRDPEQADVWELRGMLTCGHCGGLLSTNSNPSATASGWLRGKQRRYVCARRFPSRTQGAVCDLPPLLAADERISDTANDRRVALDGIEELAWELVTDLLFDPERLRAELDRVAAQHAEARGQHQSDLAILDAEISKQERLLRRASEEKLKVEPDDERYVIYQDAELRTAAVLKRLRTERDAYAAQAVAGLSDDEMAVLERTANEFLTGIEEADASARRRVYQLLRLRARVFNDPADGVRVGRDARVRVVWESEIPVGAVTSLLKHGAGHTSQGSGLRTVAVTQHGKLTLASLVRA